MPSASIAISTRAPSRSANDAYTLCPSPASPGASIVDLAVMEVVDVFGDPAVVNEVVLALLPLPLGAEPVNDFETVTVAIY